MSAVPCTNSIGGARPGKYRPGIGGHSAPDSTATARTRWSVQQALAPMHLPLQTLPPLQETPHLLPSQVALPPAGAGHIEQALPQLFTDRFDTQALPHR